MEGIYPLVQLLTPLRGLDVLIDARFTDGFCAFD
jgi:hypothetical protein